MNLQVIYTDRYHQNYFSWDVVHEWEDILCEHFNLTLVDSLKVPFITKYAGKACNFSLRKVPALELPLYRFFWLADWLSPKKNGIYFELDLVRRFYFAASGNVVPVIIDFWKYYSLPRFYKTYKRSKVVFITSLETYNHLKKDGCPVNIQYYPLTLPDKYRLSPDATFNKVYDIIMPGRSNKVLWEYLQEYVEKHPGVEYIYQERVDWNYHYFSNKTGLIERAPDRAHYWELLRASKVSFYSTPGIDGGEHRTGGFNPVTPRYLEMISAGCRVIARYPQNEDTAYYEMNTIGASADSYAIFEQQLDEALNATELPVTKNAAYLDKFYTSATVGLIESALSQIK